MVFKDENGHIIDQNEVWKYECVGSDDNTVYFKIPSDNYLRFLRNQHCFSIINRGRLWYNTLNETQIEELKTWYQAWLDVTETKVIPDKPIWLK